MTDQERVNLVEAMIPIEALCIMIKTKPFKELSYELQIELLKSCNALRTLAFEIEENT